MTTNTTEIAPCTYSTCSVAENGQLHYIPSFTGNVLLLALFVAFLIAHIAIALRYKTWTFLIAMVGGLVLEIVGYAGRIMLHQDDFNENNFIIYLVGLTIGPAFFSAAIYLCLSRVIAVFGTRLSYFRAKTITAVFICCDVISLVLQAGGGGLIANLSGRSPLRQTALNILIAGLAAQVVSMTLFICVCLQLAWSIRKNPHQLDPNNSRLRRSRAFKLFLLGKCTSSLSPSDGYGRNTDYSLSHRYRYHHDSYSMLLPCRRTRGRLSVIPCQQSSCVHGSRWGHDGHCCVMLDLRACWSYPWSYLAYTTPQ